MSKYKPDQGVYARTTSFIVLGALTVFGCQTAYYWLLSFKGSFLGKDLAGGDLPVLSVPLTPALLIATAVAVLLVVLMYRFLNQPKPADMLIDSETEMRKCTWPSWDETFTSSLVVVVVMIFFMGLLAAMDLALNRLFTDWVF